MMEKTTEAEKRHLEECAADYRREASRWFRTAEQEPGMRRSYRANARNLIRRAERIEAKLAAE